MFNLMQIKVKIYNCLSYLITFLHIYTGHYDNLITERQGALLILRDKKQNKTQRQKKKKTSSEKTSCQGLWSGKARRDFLNKTIIPSSPILRIKVVRLTKY